VGVSVLFYGLFNAHSLLAVAEHAATGPAEMWTIRLLRWEVEGVVAMIGTLGGLV
jgi:hypothetical protein